MSSLLNRTNVRKFALDTAKRTRAHPFERVSADFLDRAEGQLRQWIAREIKDLPSKGKTIT